MAPRRYMLDTNICSLAMRAHEGVYQRLSQCQTDGDLTLISALVYSELRDGVLNPKASPKLGPLLEAFLERLDAVVPWDRDAADRTAAIRRSLRLAGTPIGLTDSAMAGHALALGATLVTNNTREFARVQGLALEDWT
jgi:tRNA(fMet)-specific endonuclease VapC